MNPILLSPISTDDISREEWLKWREHGPDGNIKWTLGGSDVATIFNISPWTTSLELYERKKGIKPVVDVEYNEDSKEMGHLNEAHIARLFEMDLKKQYPEKDIKLYFDKHMYQCGDLNEDGSVKYPWLIVNYDAYVIIDGKIYLVEIKTTSPRNYDVIENWKAGIAPEYYECQCRYYMKALDVDGIFIVCAWGLQGLGEGRNYVFIERDKEIEETIVSECQKFIDCLENDTPPEIWDCDATLLRKYWERLYGPNEIIEEFEMPPEYRNVIEQYLEVEKQIERRKTEIEQYEKVKDECIVALFPLFQQKQKGKFILDDTHDVYITSKQSYKRDIPFKDEYFRTTYPDEYKKYSETKINMSLLKKEQPRIFADVTLPKTPNDKRSWKVNLYKKKVQP